MSLTLITVRDTRYRELSVHFHSSHVTFSFKRTKPCARMRAQTAATQFATTLINWVLVGRALATALGVPKLAR